MGISVFPQLGLCHVVDAPSCAISWLCPEEGNTIGEGSGEVGQEPASGAGEHAEPSC